mgnify:CR=1 FL=1
MLCGLPAWLVRWAAEVALFIETERREVPARILAAVAGPAAPINSTTATLDAVTSLSAPQPSADSGSVDLTVVDHKQLSSALSQSAADTLTGEHAAAAAAEAYDLKQHRMQTLAITYVHSSRCI